MIISISNDAVVEQQETFGVRLSTTDQSVNLTQDEASVIINDDTGRVTHIDIKQSRKQSGTLTLCLSILLHSQLLGTDHYTSANAWLEMNDHVA